MRQVRDTTGRFSLRPHYEERELDRACEHILAGFFKKSLAEIPVPIATDDLTRLIERDVSDFDPGADLSEYGSDVEGITEFRLGEKPRVRIAAELAWDERRENRYRTTLTHEYGHVHFHAYLFEIEGGVEGFFGAPGAKIQVCKRETIVTAANRDWMEWQAGYVCGALLMPKTALFRIVASYQEKHRLFGPIGLTEPHARALIELVRAKFRVSDEAARVRLLKLNLLAVQSGGASLFG